MADNKKKFEIISGKVVIGGSLLLAFLTFLGNDITNGGKFILATTTIIVEVMQKFGGSEKDSVLIVENPENDASTQEKKNARILFS